MVGILKCLGRFLLLPTSRQDPNALRHKRWNRRPNAATAESFEKGGFKSIVPTTCPPPWTHISPRAGYDSVAPKMYNTVVPEQHCAPQRCTRTKCATNKMKIRYCTRGGCAPTLCTKCIDQLADWVESSSLEWKSFSSIIILTSCRSLIVNVGSNNPPIRDPLK